MNLCDDKNLIMDFKTRLKDINENLGEDYQVTEEIMNFFIM